MALHHFKWDLEFSLSFYFLFILWYSFVLSVSSFQSRLFGAVTALIFFFLFFYSFLFLLCFHYLCHHFFLTFLYLVTLLSWFLSFFVLSFSLPFFFYLPSFLSFSYSSSCLVTLCFLFLSFVLFSSFLLLKMTIWDVNAIYPLIQGHRHLMCMWKTLIHR